MIETSTDAAVFGLALLILFLMVWAIGAKIIEKFGQALRGWLG